MELLLNLVWLTLAAPAVWVGRRESVCVKDGHRLDRIRPFLLLSCVLVLLFPVVSATDDLHAMRQEMEESSPSKRMVKQVTGERSLAGMSDPGALPTQAFPVLCGPSDEACGQALLASVVLPQPARSDERASRAPPLSSADKGGAFAA